MAMYNTVGGYKSFGVIYCFLAQLRVVFTDVSKEHTLLPSIDVKKLSCWHSFLLLHG